jgi:hypothetical protein
MTPPARPDRKIRPATDEGLIRRVPIFARRRDGQPQASIALGLVGGEGAAGSQNVSARSQTLETP